MKAIHSSKRLEFIAVTPEIIRADLHDRERLPVLLAAKIGLGWPPPLYDVQAMECVKHTLNNEPETEGWTAWYWILRDPRVLVGMSGFKTRPQNGAVEIGYSTLPHYQRRGFATEAVLAMTDWAFARDVRCVFAETLPELHASQRVLIKCGFQPSSTVSEPGVLRFERLKP